MRASTSCASSVLASGVGWRFRMYASKRARKPARFVPKFCCHAESPGVPLATSARKLLNSSRYSGRPAPSSA